LLGGGLSGDLLRRSRALGMRKGSWRLLGSVERALFRASIAYTSLKGRVVNARLVGLLSNIIGKLRADVRGSILRLGRSRALSLRGVFSERGVFNWCPPLGSWLEEAGYIFYLGATWRNTAAMFRCP